MLAVERIRAESGPSPLADKYEEQVRAKLPAGVGPGGELLVAEETAGPGMLRNTVLKPDQVAADASRDRLWLAEQAGALETAIDTADTIEAANSLEKMLAHQLAALHTSAMLLTGQAKRLTTAWRDGR